MGLQGATDINLVTAATTKMTVADTAAALATTGLTEAEQIHILRLKGVGAEEAAAMVQTYNYAAAETTATATTSGLTVATTGLKTALHGLKAAFMSNPIGFIVTAAITAITLISSLTNSIEDASEKAIESAQKARESVANLKEEKSQIDSLIKKYKELRESGKWDASTRSEITDIQAELTRLVGKQADSLDLVNGKLDEELAKLKKISGDWDNDAISTYASSLRENLKLKAAFSYENDPYGGKTSNVFAVKGHINDPDSWDVDENDYALNWFKSSGLGSRWLKSDGSARFSYGSKGNLVNVSDLTIEQTLKLLDDWIETIGKEDDFDSNQFAKDYQTEVIKLRDQFKKDVYSPVLESAQDLAKGIIKDETEPEKNFVSIDDYLSYRDKIISKVTNNTDIQDAIEQGVLSSDAVEQMVNDYFSTLDSYSDYYEEWYNKSASSIAKRGDEFKALFAESLTPDDPAKDSKIKAFNDWFDGLTDGEKEIVFSIREKYNNDHVKSELKAFSEGGTVDLTLRPQVDSSAMKAAGWDVEDGSISTVFTSTFSDEAETRFLNFTPIIADEKGNFKGVLTPDELAEYARGVINGTKEDDLKLQIGAEFDNADAAVEAAIAMHQYQDWFYTKGNIAEFTLDQWKDAIANYEIPETDKFHFSDLVSDESFQDEIKDYKDNLTTLSDALKSLRDGSLSDSDFIELYEKFPELASQTDNLDNAIVVLINDFETDAISMFNEELEYMKTEDDVLALNALKDSILGLSSEAKKVSSVTAEIDKLNDSLDDLQGTFDDIKGVIDDYNENGFLTLDNLQSIMDLQPEYVNLLIDENGQINLNNQAYKDYIATKAKLLLVDQLISLYDNILGMTIEEAQAYANAKAFDEETRSVKDLLVATTELYYLKARQKDLDNKTTVYTDAMNRSFATAANYAAMVDSYINSLSTTQNEFTKAVDNSTSALKSEKEALEDAKDALSDYQDDIKDAQSAIQDLIDLVIEYIKQMKENEMDALSDQIDALETQKDNYADIISKKKEALKLAKEEKEVNDDIADKQKAVAKDVLSLAVANLDDSSAGKKAQKKAKDNLISSNKDLQDALADQAYNIRIAALEKEQELYEANIDKQISLLNDQKAEIQAYLDDVRRIYEDACSMIDNDTGELYGKLWNEYVYPYTTKTRTEFDHLWLSAQTAIQKYKGDNDTLIGTMEYLQGEIYHTEEKIGNLEKAIDITNDAIDKTSGYIDNVSYSLGGLGESISDYMAQLAELQAAANNIDLNPEPDQPKTAFYVTHNGKTYKTGYNYNGDTEGNRYLAAAELTKMIAKDVSGFDNYGLGIVQGYLGVGTGSAKQWYVDVNGKRYTAVSKSKDNAIRQIMQQGLDPRAGYYVRQNIKHYASGTYGTKGGLFATQENGLFEALFGKLANGKYTLMPDGSHVFNGKATENLHEFADDPGSFMARKFKEISYAGYLKSYYGDTAKNIREHIDSMETYNTDGSHIEAPISIVVEGDATQSTVNALRKEAQNIKEDTIKTVMHYAKLYKKSLW